MDNFFSDKKKISKLMLVASAGPLGAALVSQYFFGLHPCELCIFQRIPYALIIFLSIVSLFKPSQKKFVICSVIAIHAFLVDAGIAFYHVGVEKNWWVSGDCTSKLNMTSFDTLKASLLAAPAVRCDDIQFEFLSVSMAGWNFIYATCATLFFIYALVKYSRFRNEPIEAEAE